MDDADEMKLLTGNKLKTVTPKDAFINACMGALLAVLSVACIFLVYGRICYGAVFSVSGKSMTLYADAADVVSGQDVACGYVDDSMVYVSVGAEFTYEDVVIVNTADEAHSLIKRVVGLGGDKLWLEDGYIHMITADGTIEKVYTEAFGCLIDEIIPSYEGNLRGTSRVAPFVVPVGHVYFVGDNRNHSNDSRMIGSTETDAVFAKVNGFVPEWYAWILRFKGDIQKGV